MDIRKFKIFKLISSVLLFTFFVMLIRDYAYANTTVYPSIPSLSEIRENAGEQYTRDFIYLGVNEKVAIENNANKFINTISDAYERNKKDVNDTFESQKTEVNNNKVARANEIYEKAESDKKALYDNFIKQRQVYDEKYKSERAKVIADYDKAIKEAEKYLRKYQANADQIDSSQSTLDSESGKGTNKQIDNINKKAGQYTSDSVDKIDESSNKIVNKDAAKVAKWQKKIKSLKEQKEKDLQGLETRRNYYLEESEKNYKQDIDSLELKTNGYIEALENLTNEKLEELEDKKNEGIATLYNNALSEINNYLFNGDDGILYSAYSWDEQAIMRDLESPGEGNKVIKSQEDQGGYIGDLKNYNAIQETNQTARAMNFLDSAEKVLKSGVNNSVKIANDYIEEASMLGKDVSIVEAKKISGAGNVGKKPVNISTEDKVGMEGESATEGPDVSSKAANVVGNMDEQTNEIKDNMSGHTKGIINAQNKATATANEEINASTQEKIQEQKDLTLAEMQDLLNFVNQIEFYLNLAWPEGAASGMEYSQEAYDEALRRVDEASVDRVGAIVALTLSCVAAAASIIVALVKYSAGLVLICTGLALVTGCPCIGFAMIAGGTVAVALATLAIALSIVAVALAAVYYTYANSMLKKALEAKSQAEQERQAYENALWGITKGNQESDEDFNARKAKVDNSYTRFLKSQEDYQRALQNFRDVFYNAFKEFARGPLMLKIMRSRIKEIHKLIRNRKLSELSEEELKKLQTLLYEYGFVAASKNNKLRNAMNNLSEKYEKYQRDLQALENDQTLVEYKDPTNGDTKMITMAEAYKQYNFLTEVIAALQKICDDAEKNASAVEKIGIKLGNAVATLFGGSRVVVKDGHVTLETCEGVFNKWIRESMEKIKEKVKIPVLRQITMYVCKVAMTAIKGVCEFFLGMVFGGIQQINGLSEAFAKGGTKGLFATLGGGMIGGFVDAVTGLFGIKSQWLISVMQGKNFLEAIGWDKESREKGIWNNFVDNVDAGAATKLILQIVQGGITSGKMPDFKNMFSITSGFFSTIKELFTSGNVLKVIAGALMVISTPLVLPFIFAADLVYGSIKGIVEMFKSAKSIGSSTITSVVRVFESSGKMFESVAKSTFNAVANLFGSGIVGRIIGGVLGGLAAGIAVAIAAPFIAAYTVLGVVSAIMGAENKNGEITVSAANAVIDATKFGGFLNVVGTAIKSVGKFLTNILFDIDADTFSKADIATKIQMAVTGFQQFIENVQTIGFIVVAAITGEWGLFGAIIPYKIFENNYRTYINGVKKIEKDAADSAMQEAFGSLELETNLDMDVTNDSQIYAIKKMIDYEGAVYVEKNGEMTHMNIIEFEEYLASGGDISKIQVKFNGEYKTFNILDSTAMRQAVISQMSTASLNLMMDELNKKQRETKDEVLIEDLQKVKELISTQRISRSSNDTLRALNILASSDNANVDLTKVINKYKEEKISSDLLEQVRAGDKKAIKQYNSLMEEIGKETINIGGVNIYIRDLNILSGHDFTGDIISNINDPSLIKTIITKSFKNPTIQTNIQENIAFRNIGYTKIAKLNECTENVKKAINEDIDEELDKTQKKLDKVNEEKGKIEDEINKLDKELTEVLATEDKSKYMTDEDKGLVKRLQIDIDDLDKSIAENEDNINLCNKKIIENEQELETNQIKSGKIERNILDLDDEISVLKNKLRNDEEALAFMQESNKQTKLKIQEAEKDIENQNKQMETINKEILDLTENETNYRKQVKTMEDNININESNINKLKQEKNKAEAEYAEYEKEYNQKVNKARTEKMKLEEDNNVKKQCLEENKVNIEEINKKIDALDEKVFSAQFDEKHAAEKESFTQKAQEVLKDNQKSIKEALNQYIDELKSTRIMSNVKKELTALLKPYAEDQYKFGKDLSEKTLDNLIKYMKSVINGTDPICSRIKEITIEKAMSLYNQKKEAYALREYSKAKNSLFKERDQLFNEGVTLKLKIEDNNKNIESCQKIINKPKQTFKDNYSAKISKLTNENNKLLKEITNTKIKIDKTQKDIGIKKDQITKINGNIKIKKTEIIKLQKNIKDESILQKKIETNKDFINNKTKEKIDLEKNLDSIKNKIKILEDDNIKRRKSIKDSNDQILSMKKTKEDKNNQIEELKTKGWKAKCDDIRTKKSEIENSEEYKNLKKDKARLEKVSRALEKDKKEINNPKLTLDDFHKIINTYKDKSTKNDDINQKINQLEGLLNDDQFIRLNKISLEFVNNAGGENTEFFYKKLQELKFMKAEAGIFSQERKDLGGIIEQTEAVITTLEIRKIVKSLKTKTTEIVINNSKENEKIDNLFVGIDKKKLEKKQEIFNQIENDLAGEIKTENLKDLTKTLAKLHEINNIYETEFYNNQNNLKQEYIKKFDNETRETIENVKAFMNDSDGEIVDPLKKNLKEFVDTATKEGKNLIKKDMENLKIDENDQIYSDIKKLDDEKISNYAIKLKQEKGLDISNEDLENSIENIKKFTKMEENLNNKVNELENKLKISKPGEGISLKTTKMKNYKDILDSAIEEADTNISAIKVNKKEKNTSSIKYDALKTVNKNLLGDIISAYEVANKKDVSLKSFENVKESGKIFDKMKQSLISKIKQGDLYLESYSIEYNGAMLSLSNIEMDNFISRNFQSQSVKNSMADLIKTEKKENEQNIAVFKEEIEKLQEGVTSTKQALNNREIREFNQIKQSIIDSNVEIDKKKAVDMLDTLLKDEELTGPKLFGEKARKKDAINNFKDAILKIDKEKFTSKDFKMFKNDKGQEESEFNDILVNFAKQLGSRGISVLKAMGYNNIDKDAEINFIESHNKRKIYEKTGVIISETQKILKHDASQDLKNELTTLVYSKGIKKGRSEILDSIEEIDIKNINKKGKQNIFEKISDNLIEQDAENLGKTLKKIAGEEEYKNLLNDKGNLDTEKARKYIGEMKSKDIRDKKNEMLNGMNENDKKVFEKVFEDIKTINELEYKKEGVALPSLVESMMKQTNADMGVLNKTVKDKIRPILDGTKKSSEKDVDKAKKLDYVIKKLDEVDSSDGIIEIDKTIMEDMRNIMKDGKAFASLSELDKMFISKGLQLMKSNLNGLEGDSFEMIEKGKKVLVTRADINNFDKEVNNFVNKDIEDMKASYFKKLDQMIEVPMQNIMKKMKETIMNNEELKTRQSSDNAIMHNGKKLNIQNGKDVDDFLWHANYTDIEKTLGDLKSDDILKAAFPDYNAGQNLTSTQGEIMRAITLKMAEGHWTNGEDNVPARLKSFSEPTMSQSQNQLIMMEANDAGNIVALGMGGGKTRVYPLVIASQMLTGKSKTAEIIVSAKQEVSNMLGNKMDGEKIVGFDDSGNTKVLKRFFGVDMENGTLGNDDLAVKLNKATDKTIFVFDLETRGHLAHEVRQDRRLSKLNDVATVAIDEADTLALRQQSFINASKKAASYDVKYQVVKTLEIYYKTIKKLKEEDSLIETKAFTNENGTNHLNPQVLTGMLEEMKKDNVLMNNIYNPSGVKLKTKQIEGQFQYVIEQVLRAKSEFSNGETVGGFKTDSVNGIQFGVQDGVDINSVATQAIESYVKNNGDLSDFTMKNFKETMKIKSLDEFKAEVSVTSVEASTQEILTKNKGVRLNVFGGSGTVYGAKTISRAVSAPVLEISEGTFIDYNYKTKIIGKQTASEMASEFMNSNSSERNWGKLTIQEHGNIKTNLMKTLKDKAEGNAEIEKFLENVSKITGKTDRVSTAEFSADYGTEGNIIDKAFNKENGKGYKSLGELIRSGKVKYDDNSFKEVNENGELGRTIQVSMMDILKSRTAINSIINDDIKTEKILNKLETKKIYVIDNYTNADNVSPLAKKVAENEYSVFATAKAGRGMDFKGKMKLLVLDTEKISKNDLLQILGRVGRGNSKDTFSRTVAVDISSMKTRFEGARNQLEAKMKGMKKGYDKATKTSESNRSPEQKAIIKEYDNVKSKIDRYDAYIQDINDGNFRESVNEMIQDSSIVLADNKANASALYQIGEGLRTAILKIPLEEMKKNATGNDKKKIELVINEVIRKSKGQEADLLRQEDGGFKSPKEILEKMIKSNYELAENVYGMLGSNKQKSRIARDKMLGITETVEDKKLLSELKYRREDIEAARKNMKLKLEGDWDEIMINAQKKADSTGIYTMSQINSSNSFAIAEAAFDTALYLSKDLLYSKKVMTDNELVKKVNVVNTAITGDRTKGVFKFNTNDEAIIAYKIKSMEKKGWTYKINKDKYEVSHIVLTPRQYNNIQKSPIVKNMIDNANNKVKIIVASNENMIKENNVFSYNDYGAKKAGISDKKNKFYEKLGSQQIIKVGNSYEDKILDKNAKNNFKKRIKDENLGINEKFLSSQGNIVVNIDSNRWRELSDIERQDIGSKIERMDKIKSKNGTGKVTLAVSSDKAITISKEVTGNVDKTSNNFERKDIYLQKQKLMKESMQAEKEKYENELVKLKDQYNTDSLNLMRKKEDYLEFKKEKEKKEKEKKEDIFEKKMNKKYTDLMNDKDLTPKERYEFAKISLQADRLFNNFSINKENINSNIEDNEYKGYYYFSEKIKGVKESKDNVKLSSMRDIIEEVNLIKNNTLKINLHVNMSKDILGKINLEEKRYDEVKKDIETLRDNINKLTKTLNLNGNLKKAMDKTVEIVKQDNFSARFNDKDTKTVIKENLNTINKEIDKVNEKMKEVSELSKNIEKVKNFDSPEIAKDAEIIELNKKIEETDIKIKEYEKKVEDNKNKIEEKHKNIKEQNERFSDELNALYVNTMKYNITSGSKGIDKRILGGKNIDAIEEDVKKDLKTEIKNLEKITDNNMAKLIIEKNNLERDISRANEKINTCKNNKNSFENYIKTKEDRKEIVKEYIDALDEEIEKIREKNKNKIDRLYELNAMLEQENFDNYYNEEIKKLDDIKKENKNSSDWVEDRQKKLNELKSYIDDNINNNEDEDSKKTSKKRIKFNKERKEYIEAALNKKYLDNMNKLFTLNNSDYITMESIEDVQKIVNETILEKQNMLEDIRKIVGNKVILNIDKEEEDNKKDLILEDSKDVASEEKSELISENSENSEIKLIDSKIDILIDEDEEKNIDIEDIYNKNKDKFYKKVMKELEKNAKDKAKGFDYSKVKDIFGKLSKADEKISILTERIDILRSMDPASLSDFIFSDYIEDYSYEEKIEEKEKANFNYLKAQSVGKIIMSSDKDLLDEYNKFDKERRKSLFGIEEKNITKELGFSYRFKKFFKEIKATVFGWVKSLWKYVTDWDFLKSKPSKTFIGKFSNFGLFLRNILSFLGLCLIAILSPIIAILGTIEAFVLALFNPSGVEGIGVKQSFTRIWAVVWRVFTLGIPLLVNKVIQKIKYNNVFKKGAKERLTLDFSNSIFREAKRHLNEGKITETEYKDLIAMEIEQTLFDKYINNENNDLLEIVVSSEKQKENELAIRQGIKAFNERANSLIIREHAEKLPNIKKLPNIIIRDTKGNIVDVYSNVDVNLEENINGENHSENRKLISRNEEIEEALSKDNFGMDSSLQTMFRSMNLDLGNIGNINIKRIDITDTSKINRLKKQKEEIHQKISSINKEPLIINLDNVRDKDIDELTSYVFREVVESGNITTNIVFTKNGRFFGATEKKVADKVEAWNDFEDNLGIEKITRKNIYKNININSSLIGSNLETNYMTESINTSEDIGDNTNYEKDKMLYFDPSFIDENGEKKEAYEVYKVDVIGEKVKITLNKECMYIWNKEENRQNFMYRLRQIEKQYRDLKKEIEIELPEIKKGDESKNLLEERKRKEKETKAINGREAIKKTCETFVLEYKNEEARRIYLQNDKGNILRVNFEGLFGSFANFEEIKEKEVIIVPEYVLTDELIFKNWLAQKLQANNIRQRDDIILGLNNSHILPGKIIAIIEKYFKNENIKVINRRGENIKIKEQKALDHISDKDGEITINNPKINQRIINKIKSMNNIKSVQISDDFAKDTESVNMLISILNAKGYNGDINIIGYNGDIVKLWQTKIFEKGAISRELDNKKEFDEFLEAVSKNDILSKYPLVLNINSREKLKLKNLNKLIDKKKLGNVTVLVRGEILATNDENILRGEEKFEKLRDKSIKKLDKSKIEDINVKNIDNVLEVTSEEELKKDLCIVTKNLKSEKEDTDKKDDKKDDKNKETNLEAEKINILPVKNIPIYRGNILFNMKGAKDYIKDLDNLYKKENLTDEDITNISTQSSKAIGAFGLDFALESRKKMNKEANSNKSITKFLDIAA